MSAFQTWADGLLNPIHVNNDDPAKIVYHYRADYVAIFNLKDGSILTTAGKGSLTCPGGASLSKALKGAPNTSDVPRIDGACLQYLNDYDMNKIFKLKPAPELSEAERAKKKAEVDKSAVVCGKILNSCGFFIFSSHDDARTLTTKFGKYYEDNKTHFVG